MGLSAALMPVSLLITESPLRLTIVFFSMALFGHQFWSTILQTLAADLFPSSVVGSVAGPMGAVGSFGGVVFAWIVGVILTHFHGYSMIFLAAGQGRQLLRAAASGARLCEGFDRWKEIVVQERSISAVQAPPSIPRQKTRFGLLG